MNWRPHPFPWIPDNGDGTFSNPIIHADYSDPDVIRHGEDFWMTSSSFQCTPGLPILHSRDLVNWRIVNHALRQVPHPSYSEVRRGCGVWAPAIRFHAGKFWIFFPMPDEGIYVTTADDPAGEWSEPWCLAKARGWIDPCPFWDDDGSAYLAHAYAFSRSGKKERIHLRPMSPDGTHLLGGGKELFHTPHHTYLEGPKLHKHQGWYYILCPGGGVQSGWQVVFRSREIWGPYEEKVVLEQGPSPINGPHQGALVDLEDGTWWFVHFQDCGPFGRIVHLQPVRWEAGWPVMGRDTDGNGIGEPVAGASKPLPFSEISIPATSDDFSSAALGLQWQWNANNAPAWHSLTARPGFLRLYGAHCPSLDLTTYPRFLGQKFPARAFVTSTDVDVSAAATGSLAGLAVSSGSGAHFLALKRLDVGSELVLGAAGTVTVLGCLPTERADLAVEVFPDGSFQFLLPQGLAATPSPLFQAVEGGWIGARVGLFHFSPEQADTGYADFSRFSFSPPN